MNASAPRRTACAPATRSAAAVVVLALVTVLAPAAHAQDRAEMERTQIIGNRELPKVLYIVPWKRPVHGSMGGRAVHGVIDEALSPVDREILARQVRYDAQIRAAAAPPGAAAASPVTPASTQ